MRVNPALAGSRLFAKRPKGLGFGLRLLGCFLSVAFTSGVIPLVERWRPENNLLWVANGMILACLLLAPRWRWPAYLFTSFLALSVRTLFLPASWQIILLYNLLDMIEVGSAALLLRPRLLQLPRFTERAYLLRFIAFGVLLGPALAGALFALTLNFWPVDPQPRPFSNWAIADGLGIAISTPAFVAVFRARLRNTVDWSKEWRYPLLLLAVATVAFSQNSAPLVYFIYPLLVLVLVRLGLGYASLFTLFVSAIAGWFTIHGRGPFALPDTNHPAQPGLHMQLAIASAIFLIYTVSVVLESRRSIERRLENVASLHQLVTENSRDAIILADFDGRRSYVSAAACQLTGWTPAQFAGFKSLDLVHPDDLSKAVAAVRQLRNGASEAMIECRVRNAAGEYMWAESSLRIVRDPRTGAPSGLLNIVRDITERRRGDETRTFQHSVMRAIYRVSLDGILVVNSDNIAVAYNKRFTEVWRIADTGLPDSIHEDSFRVADDELLPRAVGLVKDPIPFFKRVRELYANPDAVDQCEIPLKDGRTLERYSTCVRSDGGLYLGRVWFFRDISDRKLAEERLREAYSAVEALASTDPLTGLANRRQFDKVLNSEWRRALRDSHPLSLLMIDADRFKSYNDTYGHPRGDNCLRQIAETVQDVLSRPGDLAARLGGEEFAVILPNTDAAGALQLANDVCEAMRARQLPHIGNPQGLITVSIGCATVLPSSERRAVNLIEQADKALYRAKSEGRDRVCIAAELDDPHIGADETTSARQEARKSA